MPGCKRPYGVVQTEYVEVPDALLAKTAEMKKYFDAREHDALDRLCPVTFNPDLAEDDISQSSSPSTSMRESFSSTRPTLPSVSS
jgi:NADPH-dependent 7-cyano-7-deazaguanine reductase QueF